MSKKQETELAKEALKEVAEEYGVSLEEVRQEIADALCDARENPDPGVQENWKRMGNQGARMTPEEAVAYLARLASTTKH